MRIILVRHGRAVDREDPRCPPDPERYLTKEGRKKTRKVADGFAAIGIDVEAMLSSPLLRARETAAIFAEVLGQPPARITTTHALLPDASPLAVLDEIRGLEKKTVMLFGHAPHLDRMIARLLGARRTATRLKKSGIAGLTVKSFTQRNAVLDFLLTPGAASRMRS